MTTEILTDDTLKNLMQTVCWLFCEAEAGRKTMAEADAYYAGIMRLVEQSQAAKVGN